MFRDPGFVEWTANGVKIPKMRSIFMEPSLYALFITVVPLISTQVGVLVQNTTKYWLDFQYVFNLCNLGYIFLVILLSVFLFTNISIKNINASFSLLNNFRFV